MTGGQSVDVAIVAALEIELDPIRRQLAPGRLTPKRIERGAFRVDFGELAGRSVAIVQSGVGQANAVRATATVFETYRPKCVISCGLAGGLTTSLGVGDIVIATSIAAGPEQDEATTEAQTRESLAAESNLCLALAASESQFDNAVSGKFVSVTKPLLTPEQKRAVASATGAIAVDMESYGVAQWGVRNNVPVSVVRAISDTAAETLPSIVGTLVTSNIWQQTGRVAGSILRRPLLAKELWQLRSRALEAADRLAPAVIASISHAVDQRLAGE